MLSHDLAHELLKRRNNDIVVVVKVNGYDLPLFLRDHPEVSEEIRTDEIVGYNHLADHVYILVDAIDFSEEE